MRATRAGERTAFNAESNSLSAEAAPTICDDTTTGLPGSEDAIEDEVILLVTFEASVEDTTTAEKAASKLLLVCLAVMIEWTKKDEAKLQPQGENRIEKTAAQTHVSELETNCTTSHSWNAQYIRLRNPVCPTRHMVHRLSLTSIGSTLT